MKTNSFTRCLVVDDNPDLLKVIRLMLAHVTDVEVCCCNSAAEAIEKYSAAPGDFQFVITDLDMPEMNGIGLCHRLHGLAPELPVVLATGSAYISEEEAAANGFLRLLHKPFPLATLRDTLKAIAEKLAPAEAIAA